MASKNPNVNPNDLANLFTADPTTIQNSRGTFAGKYCAWIGNQYIKGKLKVGDIPELKKALDTYNINKSQITTPINNIKSLSDLIAIISNYTDDFKASRQLSKGEQDLEKVYEDSKWVVYIPHTYAASRKIGGDTHWCTASSDNYYFNMYTKQGPLYVNIRKSDGAKFQFHFPSHQFMDANDEKVRLNNIKFSKGLKEFYSNQIPDFPLLFNVSYDYCSDFRYNGYAIVINNYKYNLTDKQGKLFSPKLWFDRIDDFMFRNCLRVKNKGKYNYIDTRRKSFILGQWFDWIDDFNYNNYAAVSLNHKWNFIDIQGNLLSLNQWFNYAENDGYIFKVKLNQKWYNINAKGNITPIIDENTITITKSDFKKIVLECVRKIKNIK